MLQIVSGLREGQVLQRNRRGQAAARLQLTGSARGPLTATIWDGKGRALKGWRNKRLAARKKESCAAELRGIPAGGPYRLELTCSGATAAVKAFYAGDVWVLAGQSNMQGCGNIGGAARPHPAVRLLTMRREWMQAREPLHLLAESPDAVHNGGQQCAPAEGHRLRRLAFKGTGPGLFFARLRAEATGVPQGLIATAHGGTSLQQWTPRRKLEGQIGLYGSALASVESTGQPVAGVLWYQGESDANAAVEAYTERMKKLVRAWRRDLKQPGLPWVMVQLARVYGRRTLKEEAQWNRIQEQQRLLPDIIPNLGVVAAVDLPLDDNIHLAAEGHEVLARRLELEAGRLTRVGHRPLPPPRLKSVSHPRIIKDRAGKSTGEGRVVEVAFEHVEFGLRAAGLPSGFAIVDQEGNDRRAIFKTTLHGDKVRLHVSEAEDDFRLHYGLGCVPVCNIVDGPGHGLPVFGPVRMGLPRAVLPYVTRWRAHPPVVLEVPLDRLEAPPGDLPVGRVRTYVDDVFKLDGFVNEHPRWIGRTGVAFFEARMTLPEPMRLEVLMGYDGPFRLWIDGEPFFTDMAGINPCFADESSKTVRLKKGSHQLAVGMDIRRGQSWGFFLRFVRQDVSAAQRESGGYARPAYHAR
ncbi:MAG: sialate O-acetylesterase [Verrucomicrobiota bacterium]